MMIMISLNVFKVVQQHTYAHSHADADKQVHMPHQWQTVLVSSSEALGPFADNDYVGTLSDPPIETIDG